FRYRDAQRFSGSYWGASPSSRNYNNAGTEGITEAQETAQVTKPGPRTAVNPNKEVISVQAGDTVENKTLGLMDVTEVEGEVTKPGPRTAVNPNKEVISVAAGDTVEHKTFGPGVVTGVQGQGQKAVAIVQFAESEKRLLLRYAPLKKV